MSIFCKLLAKVRHQLMDELLKALNKAGARYLIG